MNEKGSNGGNQTRNFINLGYIMKVNISNPNSSEGAGNIVVIKKLQDRMGQYYTYVSGQAFRYYLRETLNELGMSLTPVDNKGMYVIESKEKDDKKRYKYIIEQHPDLDLFGFMEAEKGGKKMALRRWSPVKVSPLISIFPWQGESDLLTRKKAGQEGGDLVKVEINALNFMRGSMIIDADVIGSMVDEMTLARQLLIEEEERRRRLTLLLDALKSLDGGAKKARLLDDITPKFLIATKQVAGTPIFLNALDLTENHEVKIGLIQEVLDDYQHIIKDYVVGLRSGVFANEGEIKEAFKDRVKSVNQAIDAIKQWI